MKQPFQETIKACGTLDVLVNNAGVCSFDPLESATEEEFHRQFNTNGLGLIILPALVILSQCRPL